MEKFNIMHAEIKKVCFGPDDNIAEFVIQQIDQAETNIKLMVFWLTWKPIADALLRAKKRNVEINIILDSRSAEKKQKDVDLQNEVVVPNYLNQNGIQEKDIKIYEGELLHHKVILIDKKFIMMGSSNFFNASLLRHEENYMLIESQELYDIFSKRFNFLWEQKTKQLDTYTIKYNQK